jgi:hypothetical protein
MPIASIGSKRSAGSEYPGRAWRFAGITKTPVEHATPTLQWPWIPVQDLRKLKREKEKKNVNDKIDLCSKVSHEDKIDLCSKVSHQ